jgi:carbonic anhydrase
MQRTRFHEETLAEPCLCTECAPKPGGIFGRRTLLTGSAAALAVGMGGLEGRPARAQSTLTPDAALAELMTGNNRYTAGHLNSLNDDLAILRQHNEEKQEPFAAVLSCADSRVPVELIFDQSIAHVFVGRVAGNSAHPKFSGPSNMELPFWASR